MDQERPCLAPQLCIRCRSRDGDVYDGHCRAVVVSNADACTCPDDKTCPHSRNTLKKKISLVSTTTIRIHDDDDNELMRTSTESDDDNSSSSSSSSSSSDTDESTSS